MERTLICAELQSMLRNRPGMLKVYLIVGGTKSPVEYVWTMRPTDAEPYIAIGSDPR